MAALTFSNNSNTDDWLDVSNYDFSQTVGEHTGTSFRITSPYTVKYTTASPTSFASTSAFVENLNIGYTDASTTYTITLGGTASNYVDSGEYAVIDKAAAIKETCKRFIKSNLMIINKSSDRSAMPVSISPQEQKARDTLRDMITEKEYRKYLVHGCLNVFGKSGKVYQVWGREKQIHVYEKGRHVNNFCIHTDKVCPPTDHVINMKVLIECDEKLFITLGNVRDAWKQQTIVQKENKTLVDIFKQAKKSTPQVFRYA